jgi:Tfp pilus assembly protein FimV
MVAALLVLLAAVVITAGRAVAALGDDPASVPERPAVPTPAATSAAPMAYVVRAGDTLWSIARTLHPRGDPRPTVEALRRANGGRVDLRPGDRLVLP